MTAQPPQSDSPGLGASALPTLGHVGGEECGDFAIRIARDGTWFYHGSPIGRKPLVRLFSSVLRRDEAGDFWLITPVEKGRIVVDDAPFTAVELSVDSAGRDAVLSFRTNIDDWVRAGPDHPIRVAEDPRTGEPRPYIMVRDRLEALILRPLYYQLAELGAFAEDGSERFGVWSGGVFFSLGRLDRMR